MRPFTTCLWFDGQAEEAMNFYVSVFKNSKAGQLVYSTEAVPRPTGTVLTAAFELNGQSFLALNGGPQFKFTEAISLMVPCDDQAELDLMWDRLSEGGTVMECGWLKDKFGVAWQVIPANLPELLGNPVRAERVLAAVMTMVKLDIATLQAAYEGA